SKALTSSDRDDERLAMIRSAIKVSERVPSSIRALVALAPASAEIASPAVPPVPMEGGGASAIRQQHALPEGELGRHGPPSFERPAANQAKRLSSSVQQPGIRPQRHHSRQMPWRTGQPALPKHSRNPGQGLEGMEWRRRR